MEENVKTTAVQVQKLLTQKDYQFFSTLYYTLEQSLMDIKRKCLLPANMSVTK